MHPLKVLGLLLAAPVPSVVASDQLPRPLALQHSGGNPLQPWRTLGRRLRYDPRPHRHQLLRPLTQQAPLLAHAGRQALQVLEALQLFRR
jgi:hypothetical protein